MLSYYDESLTVSSDARKLHAMLFTEMFNMLNNLFLIGVDVSQLCCIQNDVLMSPQSNILEASVLTLTNVQTTCHTAVLL